MIFSKYKEKDVHYWVDIISKNYLSENSRTRIHFWDTILCNFTHTNKKWLPSSSLPQYTQEAHHVWEEEKWVCFSLWAWGVYESPEKSLTELPPLIFISRCSLNFFHKTYNILFHLDWFKLLNVKPSKARTTQNLVYCLTHGMCDRMSTSRLCLRIFTKAQGSRTIQ